MAEPGWRTISAVLLSFTVVWWAYGVITHQGMALHDDVTEAYVWGREFQLGYNQHPPFWAWLSGAWFLVFPRQDWAALLLGVATAAAGLLGAWFLIGRFATGATRQAAWLLLLCTPFYTFNSFKYNANSIFLLIWPWTLLCCLRAIQSRRILDALLLGVMIAMALLSKYYAITLVLTCIAASVLDANARAYWRSASPWVSIALSAVLVLPHLVWLIHNDAPPVRYAIGISGVGFAGVARQSVTVLAAAIGLQLAIPALIWLTRRRKAGGVRFGDLRTLAVLTLLPFALTLGFGLALGVRVAPAMVIGIFPLAPLLLIAMTPGADPARLVWWASRVVVLGSLACVASAPISVRLLHRSTDPGWALPLREAAKAAEARWREATGGKPLVTVGGSKYFSNAAAFYSDDHPSGLLSLDVSLAPWVTPEQLRRGGLLGMCLREDGPWDDGMCRAQAARLATPRTVRSSITVTHTAFGRPRGAATLDIYVTPPEP